MYALLSAPRQPLLLPAHVPDRRTRPRPTADGAQLTPATRAALDLRLTLRGIQSAAALEGWYAGNWPIYLNDALDHWESGWYSPIYDPNGTEIVNYERGKKLLTWKNSNSSADPHDTWSNYISGFKPVMLPKRGIFAPVQRGDGKINLVEGKADFLSMLAAGINNCVGIFGASFVPADIANQLLSWGVKLLRVFFHPDDAGAKLAQKVADFASSSLEIHYYALPKKNGVKYDLNNLWTGCDANSKAFREQLASLGEFHFTARPKPVYNPPTISPGSIPASRLQSYGLGVLRETAKDLQTVTSCRNDALNVAAFKLGTFVAVNALELSSVEADLIAIGVSLGLSVYETTNTVRSGLTAGQQHPADVSALVPKGRNVIAMTTKPKTAVEKKIQQLETAAKHAPVQQVAKPTLQGRSDLWVDESEARDLYLADRYVQPRKARGEV